MRRLLLALVALAAVLHPAPVGATVPSTTPPAVTSTTRQGAATTAARTTTTARSTAGTTANDDDDWTIGRMIVTGVAVIGALAFVGWAVAKVRNELAKPGAPKA